MENMYAGGRTAPEAVRTSPATARDTEAVTRVFLAIRTAAMPYLSWVHSDEDALAWVTRVVLPTSTGV